MCSATWSPSCVDGVTESYTERSVNPGNIWVWKQWRQVRRRAVRMACVDGLQDPRTHLPAASHQDQETKGNEQILMEVEMGMKKLTAHNRYRKVYLKLADGHQHKRKPDGRRIWQMVSLVSHIIAKSPRHSTCIYMASCPDAGQMTWVHTFWCHQYVDMRW